MPFSISSIYGYFSADAKVTSEPSEKPRILEPSPENIQRAVRDGRVGGHFPSFELSKKETVAALQAYEIRYKAIRSTKLESGGLSPSLPSFHDLTKLEALDGNPESQTKDTRYVKEDIIKE